MLWIKERDEEKKNLMKNIWSYFITNYRINMNSIHSLFLSKEHTTFLNPLKVRVAFFLHEIFG